MNSTNRLRLFAAALLGTASLTTFAVSGDEKDRSLSWFQVVGTHYRLDPESWLGLTRDWPKWANVGFRPDVTAQYPKNLQPVVGRFSGEPRYFNFRGETVVPGERAAAKPGSSVASGEASRGSLDADGLDALERGLTQRPGARARNPQRPAPDYVAAVTEADKAGIDLVWHTGQVSLYGAPESVAFLMARQGAYFKDLLYALYREVNSGPLARRQNTIYWEIGNEVNSSQRFALRDLSGGQHVQGDPGHAHDYVEYYLAPAVEALRTASAEISGDPRKVKILMGSVSGILKPENRRFLDLVLNSTIAGEHAPTLAGRKVHEVVDAVVVHYSIGDRHTLQGIYDRWIAQDKVPMLWSTEELGTRGRGDHTVALVAFRWLDFLLANRWPQSMPGGLIFWGDENVRHPGEVTQGAEMLRIIGSFLRDYPLAPAQELTIIDMRADFEWHAVSARSPAGAQRIAVYLAPHAAAQPALRGVSVRIPGLTGPLHREQLSVTGYVPTIGGKTRVITPSFEVDGDHITIAFSPLWEVALQESLILLIEARPAANTTTTR